MYISNPCTQCVCLVPMKTLLEYKGFFLSLYINLKLLDICLLNALRPPHAII